MSSKKGPDLSARGQKGFRRGYSGAVCYYTRYEFGSHAGDLIVAFDILESYDAANETVLSQTFLALGGSPHCRLLSVGSVDDLDLSIHLQDKMLESWQPNHPKRSHLLGLLAKTHLLNWGSKNEDASRTEFLVTVQKALAEGPDFPGGFSLLEVVNDALLIK